MVDLGYYDTRARARDAILRGTVSVEGRVATKPGQAVRPGVGIEILDAAMPYVSRAALKLKHALDHFQIDVAGRNALDIGASTGGFVQVLLEAGVAHVDAIDVGHGQLTSWVAANPAVSSIEGLNARDLKAGHLTRPIDLITCDVSFISLKLALPAALALAQPGAILLALIKPQFEVGREGLGKGGIVREPDQHRKVCIAIEDWLRDECHWTVLGLTPSPLQGSDGNLEFVIACRKP